MLCLVCMVLRRLCLELCVLWRNIVVVRGAAVLCVGEVCVYAALGCALLFVCVSVCDLCLSVCN